MKYFLIAVLLAFAIVGFLSCADFEGGTSKSMQQDFDKIRLDHLFIISNLVQEYHAKTGSLPFQGRSEKPVIVTIATPEQIEHDQGRAPLFVDLNTRAVNGKTPERPTSMASASFQEFKAELEKGLQRTIDLPVDPQRVPMNKPSMYFYTVYLGVFDVTAFLHHSFPFARPLGQFNNKVTVGSRSYPASGIWTQEELLKQEEFRKFIASPFNKGGYVMKTVVK